MKKGNKQYFVLILRRNNSGTLLPEIVKTRSVLKTGKLEN